MCTVKGTQGSNPCLSAISYFSDLILLENLKATAEIVIIDKNLIYHKVDLLIAKLELDAIRDIKNEKII